MSKKARIKYELDNTKNVKEPSEEDINHILRAADEIIFIGGRTILAKILKGSKDKKLLGKQLNLCPSYGCFKHMTIGEITLIVDWMIINNYLDIEYNWRLPMIVFAEKGWQTYKPFYVDEIYNKILNANSSDKDKIIDDLKKTNREVILMLLDKIGLSNNIGFIRFLNQWESVEVKKVRQKINFTINKIKSP